MTVLIWDPSLLETADEAPLPGMTADQAARFKAPRPTQLMRPEHASPERLAERAGSVALAAQAQTA
ncbi:hypothetical protein [Oleiagrimonas sp. C23AA]|uniref:hypothetical protein n=1 Tax=Oleiagrimonas sp. C23AA TaxID=2719047 RepID=UPI00141E13D4|nr:hypothetical protein [Oleiagrimonas sp. C23AA]NII09617.1 hypothetical protein [Oleiagrimonas sp. C23AA]